MKRLVSAAFLLFLSLSVFGVSSQEAKNFLLNETHYLEAGEGLEIFPETVVISEGKGYWVATITKGNSLVGFIPVKEEKKEVSFDPVTNRGLFKTTYSLRQLTELKDQLTRSGDGWFFSSSNQLYFSRLSNALSNEGYGLATIEDQLGSTEASELIEEMSQLLVYMIALSNEIKGDIDSAVKLENSFFISPDVNQLGGLKSGYESVLDSVSGLNSYAGEYDLKVEELKQLISTSGLELNTVRSLLNLADTPQEFREFEQKAGSAASLQQWFDQMFSTANASLNNWLDNLESDRKMNDAWELLYGEDPVIRKASDEKFSSLEESKKAILSEDNKMYWENQEMVRKLSIDWEKAENYFKTKKFELVAAIAKDIRNEIKQVFADGIGQGNSFDLYGIAVNAVIYLIVLLIILFVIKNRDRVFSMAGNREEDGGKRFELK